MRCLITVLSLIFLLAAPVSAATAVSSPVVRAETHAAPSEEGGIGIRLLDVPVAAQDDPRARSYIVDHLNPGTTIERRVEVVNTTDSTQTVRVYPGAGTVEEGAFTFEGEDVETELTTWTSVSDSELELAPGEQAEVMVTIDVPADAPEAEQYGVVWAEIRTPAGDGNTIQASRVGVRVYLSVGPGNGPPAAFEISALTAGRNAEGHPEVTAEVTNTGGRAVDVIGSLELANGPGGLSAGPFSVVTGTTIAPGEAAPVAVALDSQLPDGPWDATLTLKSGLLTEKATATLQFPEAGQSTDIDTNQGPGGLLWLAILGALVVLIALAVLLGAARRRKIAQG